jgi:cell division protein ZapE
MTSNYPPDELYPNGLQRQNFLPTIALLAQWLDVVEIDAGVDYRLRALEHVKTYHVPAGAAADAALADAFEQMRSGPDEDPRLAIEARTIVARKRAGSAVWFDFAALCDGPRSQRDYLELAQRFAVLLLSSVPKMTPQTSDQARRFTWLVDILYDHRVKLIASAAVPPPELYVDGPGSREFARTVSRLAEMQTHAYMGEPHVAGAGLPLPA